MNFTSLVSEWDIQIRAGQGLAIKEKVAALRVSDVPEAHLPAVAAITRRLGLFKQGLDLMRIPYLRDRAAQPEKFMIEYAALLTEIGANRISQRILTAYEKPTQAMTYFYRALMWIKSWEHERAAADLRAFTHLVDDPYWKTIADLNRLGSLIFLADWPAAAQLQRDLESRTGLSPMARGILSELQGQRLFFSGDVTSARRHFVHSADALKDTHSTSLFFAEKWILICDLMTKDWRAVEADFRRIQHRARREGYWEILRELDRFSALRFNDPETYARLYFGTPAEGYRRMLCRDGAWTPPETYEWRQDDRPGPAVSHLEVDKLNLFINDKIVPRAPRLALLLLKSLTSDLYRPLAVGSLFEQIYPGQHFDPVSAGPRVHQAISRFRKFARAQNLDIDIVARDLGFIIEARDFGIRYRRGSAAAVGDFEAALLTRLNEVFGGTEFSAADVASQNQISQRSANRLLAQAIEQGRVERIGRGRGVRYKLAG